MIRRNLHRVSLALLSMVFGIGVSAQTGNHVFSGAEVGNFNVLDLATPGGQTWSTDRAATPGYFSAIGTATYTGGSDAANVNGYVKHYADAANQDFTFPVGSGSDLRTLSISGNIPATGTYATAWIVGDPGTATDPTAPNAGAHPTTSFAAPIQSVSKVGQWDWQDLNGNGAGVTITVSIPNLTVPPHQGIISTTTLRLVGWNGTQWVDLSGGVTASGITENSTLSGTMQAGITAIGIGAIDQSLPVILSDLGASSSNCSVAIKWQSGIEQNVKQYEILESVDGGLNYKVVSTVRASGLSNYSSSFAAPQGVSKAYYMIKVVDTDGSSKVEGTVMPVNISCEVKSQISLVPNPVTLGQDQQVVIETAYSGKAQVMMYNSAGQVVLQKQVTLVKGRNSVSLPVRSLASGNYYVRVLDAQGKSLFEAQKSVKQ